MTRSAGSSRLQWLAVPVPEKVTQVVRGFAMGSADIVPGVSGGTVALVLGIYERLIENIRVASSVAASVVRRDGAEIRRRLAQVEWTWLIALGVGILAAILALSSLLDTLLTDHAEAMAGLFSGLILASVVISWRLVKKVTLPELGIMFATAAAFFLLLGLRADTESTAEEVVTRPLWVFFLAGAIAICAMILPGISGSFLLVIMGMYAEVLGAVNDRQILVLLVFVAGCVVGLASFSSLLSWSLRTHHDKVMAAMIGLMLGSLRVLWPWPDGVSSTRLEAPGDAPVVAPIALFVVGFAVVIGIEVISIRLAAKDAETAPADA
jgi:putative membrane protein